MWDLKMNVDDGESEEEGDEGEEEEEGR
jgi:hypothetical protein